jgi:hypothetical protein
MATIDVPVHLIIDALDVGEFLSGILQTDGTLRVVVCPVCFACIPFKKLSEHMEANGCLLSQISGRWS